MKRPYKLTEAHLNLRIADKLSRPKPLQDMLLASGAMEGPVKAKRVERTNRVIYGGVVALLALLALLAVVALAARLIGST